MVETKKDNHYRDFSNRTAFNGRPLLEGQILVPVVLNREMRETLKPAGLNYDYAESWHFPHAREVVPVVFIDAVPTFSIVPTTNCPLTYAL